MDNINYYPKMLMKIAEQRLLEGDPFMLFDVGCGLGIDPVWQFFGDDLRAHGFEPQEEECAKLTAHEQRAGIHYHAAFVGLPPTDPFHRSRLIPRPGGAYFDPAWQFTRGTAHAVNLRKPADAAPPPESSRAASLASTEQWSGRRLASRNKTERLRPDLIRGGNMRQN